MRVRDAVERLTPKPGAIVAIKDAVVRLTDAGIAVVNRKGAPFDDERAKHSISNYLHNGKRKREFKALGDGRYERLTEPRYVPFASRIADSRPKENVRRKTSKKQIPVATTTFTVATSTLGIQTLHEVGRHVYDLRYAQRRAEMEAIIRAQLAIADHKINEGLWDMIQEIIRGLAENSTYVLDRDDRAQEQEQLEADAAAQEAVDSRQEPNVMKFVGR
jgi:hypothetical protein